MGETEGGREFEQSAETQDWIWAGRVFYKRAQILRRLHLIISEEKAAW
jgi:hypothetical protein